MGEIHCLFEFRYQNKLIEIKKTFCVFYIVKNISTKLSAATSHATFQNPIILLGNCHGNKLIFKFTSNKIKKLLKFYDQLLVTRQ